jgi:hypothetical protein
MKRLKLKCDKPLSSFAFTFNLRRYIAAYANVREVCTLRWGLANNARHIIE